MIPEIKGNGLAFRGQVAVITGASGVLNVLTLPRTAEVTEVRVRPMQG